MNKTKILIFLALLMVINILIISEEDTWSGPGMDDIAYRNGNVGIGTENPVANFEVAADNNPYICLTDLFTPGRDNQLLGGINFRGNNSSDVLRYYAYIDPRISIATQGSETGELRFGIL